MYWVIEITDTFGGEANYSWVTRHVLKAASLHGALCKLSRASWLNWHGVGGGRWDSESGETCAFVELYDEECHAEYRFDMDERA